ncbi:hypothetical protein NMY22_g644 [Coprinellus aureogranulatus]|nr:hypothetical protein NMY22_g644 [Coprinellus aureogranulatus]
MMAAFFSNVRLPALRTLKFCPSKSCRSEELIRALDMACGDSGLWPSLVEFSYGPDGVGCLYVREGGEDFETLKARGPGNDRSLQCW